MKRDDRLVPISFARALMLAVAVVALGSFAILGLGSQAFAAQSETMHRLYNPNSGEHFYTSSEVEKNDLVGRGWQYENEGWKAPTSGDAVYRLYNPIAGEHHYTLSAPERDMLVGAGWNDEGTGWYSDPAQGVPLYRVYNPNEYANNHHYTTSTVERDHLLGLGWRDEGISWYGVNPGTTTNPSDPTPDNPGSTPDNPGTTPAPDNPNPTPSPDSKTCTVTFNANGGVISGLSTITLTKGSSIGSFPAVSRAGYELTGWHSGPTGGFQYTASTVVNSDVTIYAGWKASSANPTAQNYSVAFSANGGTGTMNRHTYNRGTSYALPMNTFKRSGYEFDGWATSPLGAKVYSDRQSVRDLAPAGATITLYARWKAVAATERPYTIKFDANGGTGSMSYQTVNRNATVSLYNNGYTRSGATFKGWNTKKDGKGASYSNRASVKNLGAAGSTVTLYAQWTFTAGEKKVGSNTYYVQSDGSYYKGWKQVGSNWRYYDTSTGARVAGKEANIARTGTSGPGSVSGYRFFDGNGNLLHGWQGVPDGKGNYIGKYFDLNTGVRYQGKEYYIDMNTRTEKDPVPGWCNFDNNGCLLYGWQGVPDGKGNYIPKYYNPDNGKRVHGEFYVSMNTKTEKDPAPGWCFFDGNGQLLYGWQGVPDGKGNYITKYYDPANGKRVHGEYYVTMLNKTDKEPSPGYRYFDPSDGHLYTNTWHGDYYYNEIGLRQTGTSTPTNPASYDETLARQIFAAYNSYRTSKGYRAVQWDSTAYEYAKQSAKHCSDVQDLQHTAYASGKTINGKRVSDILQDSTWKMQASEAVERWKNSTNHRQMMQCDSAERAAVAVYRNAAGVYYYAIVYNHGGSNHSGS